MFWRGLELLGLKTSAFLTKKKEEKGRVYYALRYCEALRMEIPFWIATVLRDLPKELLSFA